MDGTEQRTLTDSQLDRELEAALGIEPSPEFLARVRSRAAAAGAPSPWHVDVVSAFRRTSLKRVAFEPLWGVALGSIALAVVITQIVRPAAGRQERVEQVAQAIDSVPGVEGSSAPTVVPPMLTVTSNPRPVSDPNPVESFSTVPLQLSPVLVDENERRAFEFFVAAVSQGRVPEKAIEPVRNEVGIMPVATIEPLEIAPLRSIAGLNREGEGQWE